MLNAYITEQLSVTTEINLTNRMRILTRAEFDGWI